MAAGEIPCHLALVIPEDLCDSIICRNPLTERSLFMEDYRLELKNVSKSFGEVHALENINFHLGRNEIVGLLGDNGAGKSTLIKIITGYYQPTSGEIYFNGQKVDNLTVPKAR